MVKSINRLCLVKSILNRQLYIQLWIFSVIRARWLGVTQFDNFRPTWTKFGHLQLILKNLTAKIGQNLINFPTWCKTFHLIRTIIGHFLINLTILNTFGKNLTDFWTIWIEFVKVFKPDLTIFDQLGLPEDNFELIFIWS